MEQKRRPKVKLKKISESITEPDEGTTGGTLSDDVVVPIKDAGPVRLPLGELPSGNRFYNTTLTANPLKVNELVLVDNITKDNYLEMYDMILDRKLGNIHPHELLVGDEQYALIWIRENSFPSYPYKLSDYKCHSCGHKNVQSECKYGDFVFDSNINDIESEQGEVELSSGTKVTIYSRRRYHMHKVERHLVSEFKSNNIKLPMSYEKIAKIASVVEINGSKNMSDNIELIIALPPISFVELLHYIKKYTFSTKIYANTQCSECQTPNKVAFFFQPHHLLPDYWEDGANQGEVEDGTEIE
jgi:hypothetical protein